MENQWSESTILLLKKWERICHYRKSAHYTSSKNFGWKNKMMSIPIIIISTILGSLSFIHPSFIDQTTSSRMLRELSECGCDIYLNGATSFDSDLCIKGGTTECYPPNPGDGLCPSDMFSCTNINVPTESPTFNDCPAGGFCIACGTCLPGRCEDDSCPLFDGQCTCEDGSCPSKVDSSICEVSNSEEDIEEPDGGDCAELCGGTSGHCPDIGSGGSLGFWDCNCCYDYWVGCSFSSCSNWCYPDCGSSSFPTPSPIHPTTIPPTTIPPTITPTTIHPTTIHPTTIHPTTIHPTTITPTTTISPIPSATLTPSSPCITLPPIPCNCPSVESSPTKQPSVHPTKIPTNKPTSQSNDFDTLAPTSEEESNTVMFPYIIGAFNMIIAVLSALHTFLKYDALEDRHHQYSRHFSNLQVDLETILAKPPISRGDPITVVERYKTKYTVLINNAPDLPEKLEHTCCVTEEIQAIEMT